MLKTLKKTKFKPPTEQEILKLKEIKENYNNLKESKFVTYDIDSFENRLLGKEPPKIPSQVPTPKELKSLSIMFLKPKKIEISKDNYQQFNLTIMERRNLNNNFEINTENIFKEDLKLTLSHEPGFNPTNLTSFSKKRESIKSRNFLFRPKTTQDTRKRNSIMNLKTTSVFSRNFDYDISNPINNKVLNYDDKVAINELLLKENTIYLKDKEIRKNNLKIQNLEKERFLIRDTF